MLLRRTDGYYCCRCYNARWAPGHQRPLCCPFCDYRLMIMRINQIAQHTCRVSTINILRPRQNGRHFPDDIFKWIFLNEIIWISIKISLKFVPRGRINNIPALVQIMAWRRQATSHYLNQWWIVHWRIKCVTRSQWVKQRMLERGREVSNPLVLLSFRVYFLTQITPHVVRVAGNDRVTMPTYISLYKSMYTSDWAHLYNQYLPRVHTAGCWLELIYEAQILIGIILSKRLNNEMWKCCDIV